MDIIQLTSDTAFQRAIESISQTKRVIVCGNNDTVERVQENQTFMIEDNPELTLEQHIHKCLEDSKNINVNKWLTDKKEELLADMAEYDEDINQTLGSWNDVEIDENSKTYFYLGNDIVTREPIKDLKGVQVTVNESWQIPAALAIGGWNECPFPAEHTAIWKYWQQKYDAHIVGVSGDVIEAYVKNPPRTKEEALALAWEQYLYCYDIVDQGCQTITNLAASLLNNDKWFFWWD